jgi:hypothetical protein
MIGAAMAAPTVPEFRRASFADAARAAAPERPGDDGYAGTIAREAASFPQLQAIQLAFDQLAGHAADLRRGVPWPFEGSAWPAYAADVLDHARRHRDVLRTAADAADAMIDATAAQLPDAAKPKDQSPSTPNRSPRRG